MDPSRRQAVSKPRILPATAKEREEEPVPIPPSQKDPDPHSISDQNPVQSTSQEQGGSNKLKLGSFSPEEQMDAHEILPATTEEREEEPVPIPPSQKESDPHSISDQNPVQSTSQEQGSSNKVMASPVPLNRVKLLYKGHQILNLTFGILFASLAVLRWNEGRAEFDGATILICLVDFSAHILVSMISRNYAGLETYMKTAAVVLDVYSALLMVNTEYIIIGMIPFMIFRFIGALAWKSRETGASQYKNNEEVLSANNLSSKSSDKLAFFEVISYLLQLSLVTWTQYKGQQGCTPILSDFLLFLASALGALGAMLASPLDGVDSCAVSTQVPPVLHKTCTVLLLVAVHTLAAEWLGEDMIYVCLPELIVVLVWFTICFGQAMSVSSSMSLKSQVIISSVVAMLAYLTSWQANDWNMHVSWIIWVFWISLSSSALSGFHAWLLLGWPGSTSDSESNKLIHLLKVASTVGSSAAAILCVSLVLTDTSILHGSISSFEHKTIATVLSVFCSYLLYSYGHPEAQIQIALDKEYSVVGKVCTHMLVKKLYAKLDERLKELSEIGGELIYESSDRTFVQWTLQYMQEIIRLFESSIHLKGKLWIRRIHYLACEIEDWVDTYPLNPHYMVSISNRDMKETKMLELQNLVLNAMENAPANPVGLVIPRDKIVKTLDKIFQVAFKLASIVGIPGSEVQYMKSVIKDRYYQLDVELKICLLYLSIFPVKQVIEVERLVRLWIAEGFIYGQYHPRTDQEKVGIAYGYICELVRRNLIMHSSKGMKRTISIDPEIHSFIVSLSMEENFVTFVHPQEEDVLRGNDTAPRLSLLNNGKEDQATGRSYWKKLRSVTVFNKTSGIPVLTVLTRLHVLDLEGCKGPVYLDYLSRLLHLRYLSLRGTDVRELPRQIGELWYLETLDVRSTKVKEIPPSIFRLQKLMHLLAGNAKLPCGIGKMKTLFALSCPDVTTDSTSIMKELGVIDNLVELELLCESGQVSGDKKQVAFPSDGFHSLHKLSVQFGYSSLTFETGALPNVEVLGLKLDKGLPEESTSVDGIEHLRSLKNVHIKHSRDDTNAKAVVAAVEAATSRHPKKPSFTVEADEG